MVNNGGQYLLGTGTYHPINGGSGVVEDVPWSYGKGGLGSDCAGFAICWCWKLPRHRLGFNRGSWATISDDLNVNSIVEDSHHKCELTEPELEAWDHPIVGDLLCYPSFKFKGVPFIGHVALIERVPEDYTDGRYDQLTVIQCHGPDHFKPGVVRTDGSLFLHHDSKWPADNKDNIPRRTCVVRMKERF